MAHHIENYIIYNYGTSAKVCVPRVDVQKEIPEMKNKIFKRKKKIITVNCGAIFGIAMSFMLFYLIISSAAGYVNAEKELQQIESMYEYLCERNMTLNEEYETNCDFDTIKRMATDMGMISIDDVECVKIRLENQQEEPRLNLYDNAINNFVKMFGSDPIFVVEKSTIEE